MVLEVVKNQENKAMSKDFLPVNFFNIKKHYNEVVLPFFYTNTDNFSYACNAYINNYFWDKDQRAYEIIFQLELKKQLKISSNMFFISKPKANLKYFSLRFWKDQKYLLWPSMFPKNFSFRDVFKDSFNLNQYDIIRYNFGFFRRYSEIAYPYTNKKFYIHRRYEGSLSKIDTF